MTDYKRNNLIYRVKSIFIEMKYLMTNEEFTEDELNEGRKEYVDSIINKLQNSKFNEKIKDFLLKCKEEAGDYKEAGQILSKYAQGDKPTKEEFKIVYTQLIDTLKIGGSSAIFILPFGSVLLIALIKIGNKFGINFLPSAWNKNNDIN